MYVNLISIYILYVCVCKTYVCISYELIPQYVTLKIVVFLFFNLYRLQRLIGDLKKYEGQNQFHFVGIGVAVL